MEATLEKSHLVTKTKAIETPPQLKMRSGGIETKLRRKEFALRNADMKLISEGSCSTFHALLIIQTPATFPRFTRGDET
jgi:hypothetical protein